MKAFEIGFRGEYGDSRTEVFLYLMKPRTLKRTWWNIWYKYKPKYKGSKERLEIWDNWANDIPDKETIRIELLFNRYDLSKEDIDFLKIEYKAITKRFEDDS